METEGNKNDVSKSTAQKGQVLCVLNPLGDLASLETSGESSLTYTNLLIYSFQQFKAIPTMKANFGLFAYTTFAHFSKELHACSLQQTIPDVRYQFQTS